jgi:hypothetical protein
VQQRIAGLTNLLPLSKPLGFCGPAEANCQFEAAITAVGWKWRIFLLEYRREGVVSFGIRHFMESPWQTTRTNIFQVCTIMPYLKNFIMYKYIKLTCFIILLVCNKSFI